MQHVSAISLEMKTNRVQNFIRTSRSIHIGPDKMKLSVPLKAESKLRGKGNHRTCQWLASKIPAFVTNDEFVVKVDTHIINFHIDP